MEIQRIPEKTKKNGLNLEIIEKTEKVVIYRQLNDSKVVYAYQVHKVRFKRECTRKIRHPDGRINIIYYPNREVLASNEEFGRYAWSYNTYEAAKNKYNELTSNPERLIPNDLAEKYYNT